MKEEDSCICHLLTLAENVSLSAWDDQTNTKVAAPETKVTTAVRRSPFIHKGKRAMGNNTIEQPFQHNQTHKQYMQDYKNQSSKAVNRDGNGYYSVLAKYNSFVKLQLPPYVDRQQTGISTKESNSVRLNNSPTDNATKTPLTAKDTKRRLTYEDIKDYIDDENEDEAERSSMPSLLKPRKPININLTGKFVQRGNNSNANTPRAAVTSKVEHAISRKPKDDIKLPVPLKPAPIVSYKMPSSLKCKVTIERLPSHSAKTGYHSAGSHKSDSISKFARIKKKLTRTAVERDSGGLKSELPMCGDQHCLRNQLNRRSLDSLTCISGFNEVKIRTIKKESSFSNNTLDDDRKKHLEALVKILGDKTLAPYLHKAKGTEEKKVDVNPGLGKIDTIDYNIIFGSRI